MEEATGKKKGNAANNNDSNGKSDGKKGESPPNPVAARRSQLAEIAEDMRTRGLAPAEPIMRSKLGPGSIGVRGERAQSNVYQLQLEDVDVYHYNATMLGVTQGGKEHDLSRTCASDFLTVMRKRLCANVFINLREHEDCLKRIPLNEFFYDGGKILFAARMIDMNGQKQVKFLLGNADLMGFPTKYTSGWFTIAETQSIRMKLSEMLRVSENLKENDMALRQFIDIATSQFALAHPDRCVVYHSGLTYLTQPWMSTFREEDGPILPEGKYVGIGSHKSAQTIEGGEGPGSVNIGLVVDTAKTAFQSMMSGWDKAFAIVPSVDRMNGSPQLLEMLNNQFKGLFVETRHTGKAQQFKITGVMASSARKQTFDRNGEQVTVEKYFRDVYNITLCHPTAPLLFDKYGQRTNYVPLELAFICDFQRVPLSKQTPQQLRAMRNACIVPPYVRVRSNRKNVLALDLHQDSDGVLRKAGIRIGEKVLEMPTRLLHPPLLHYGVNGESEVKMDPNEIKWNGSGKQFLFPATLDRWVIVVVQDSKQDFSIHDVEEFSRKYVDICRQHGMKVADKLDSVFSDGSRLDIDHRAEEASSAGVELMFFIVSDDCNRHDFIKEAERRYVVKTQCMRVSRAIDVVRFGKWLTLDNVVNKTNVKLGGLNYDVVGQPIMGSEVLNGNRLFIGFTVAQTPRDVTEKDVGLPSVLGYASNDASKELTFRGGFCFQPGRRNDIVNTVKRATANIIAQYMNGRTNEKQRKHPEEVVVYRGGVTGNDYEMLINVEVPMFKEALTEAMGHQPRITYIAVHQRHHVRLTPCEIRPGDKAPLQNLQPGTVVDTTVVHPRFAEFFLLAHRVVQGTAKVPRYTVITDDSNMSMNQLEEMTYGLCFAHQIVSLTTSLPSPLYIAGLYADRGRRMFNERAYPADSVSDPRPELAPLSKNFDEVTTVLGYHGTDLANTRINA